MNARAVEAGADLVVLRLRVVDALLRGDHLRRDLIDQLLLRVDLLHGLVQLGLDRGDLRADRGQPVQGGLVGLLRRADLTPGRRPRGGGGRHEPDGGHERTGRDEEPGAEGEGPDLRHTFLSARGRREGRGDARDAPRISLRPAGCNHPRLEPS